jgi:hypothetical protein
VIVVDSGPMIHLASVNQFSLLKRFLQTVHTIPPVLQRSDARLPHGSRPLATCAARAAFWPSAVRVTQVSH